MRLSSGGYRKLSPVKTDVRGCPERPCADPDRPLYKDAEASGEILRYKFQRGSDEPLHKRRGHHRKYAEQYSCAALFRNLKHHRDLVPHALHEHLADSRDPDHDPAHAAGRWRGREAEPEILQRPAVGSRCFKRIHRGDHHRTEGGKGLLS